MQKILSVLNYYHVLQPGDGLFVKTKYLGDG